MRSVKQKKYVNEAEEQHGICSWTCYLQLPHVRNIPLPLPCKRVGILIVLHSSVKITLTSLSCKQFFPWACDLKSSGTIFFSFVCLLIQFFRPLIQGHVMCSCDEDVTEQQGFDTQYCNDVHTHIIIVIYIGLVLVKILAK